MYINKAEGQKLLGKIAEDTSSDIRQRADFLLALLDGDDWSLVIKAHAIIESLVTELIVSKIDEPTMKSFMERLPLSDNEIGKIRIMKDYDLISPPQRLFLRQFSELRNKLVHRVENINFSFSRHVDSLDRNQKKIWQEAYTWFEREDDAKLENSWVDVTLQNPRWAVFLAIFMFIVLNGVSISNMKGLKQLNEASQETMRRLLSSDETGAI